MDPTPRRRSARTVLHAVVLAALVLPLPACGPGTSPALRATTATVAVDPPTRSDVAPEQSTRLRRAGSRLPLGVSPGFAILDVSPARLDADLTAARRVGARRIRLDIGWRRVEYRPGRFDWSDTDRVLRAARRHRLQVLAVVGYRPEWAQLADGSADPARFGRFVDLAARRYGDLVAAWEIWNEPNLAASWNAAPDPAAYARLVAAASVGLRRHDPRARIVVGALAPAVDAADRSQMSPATFLAGFYRSGIDRRTFDAVSVHPYSYPALPTEQQHWNTFFRLTDLHRLMGSHGDGRKRIWLTEYGAPTGRTSRSVTPQRQARMIVAAYRAATARRFVGSLYVYSLRDTAAASTDVEANFGVLGHGGRPKPAYSALRRAIRRG